MKKISLIISLLIIVAIAKAQIIARFTIQPSTCGCGTIMQFDASSSTPSAGHIIQKYEWDFDYDGITFNVDATGVKTTHEYSRMKATGSGSDLVILPYTVALKIEDDNNPAESDTTTNEATLSFGNHRPVADAGDEYYSSLINDVSLPVTLYATGSYDPDSPCDSIVAYKWDTDHDGLFGSDDTNGGLCDGSECEGKQVTIRKDWIYGDSYGIELQVVDSYGLISQISNTSIEIIPPTPAITINEIEIKDSVQNTIVSGNDAPFQFTISIPDTAQTLNCKFYILPDHTEIPVYDTSNLIMTQIKYNGYNIPQTYNAYFDATAFTDGNDHYQLDLIIRTIDNLYMSEKVSRPFSIDNTAPSNPETCIDVGSEPDQCTKDNNPDFYWSGASDMIAGYYYYWGTDSTGEATSFINSSNYNPDPLLANGTYFLRINTIDKAGNEAGWTTLYKYKYYNFLSSESDTICSGDSLLWHNEFYKEYGIYHDSLIASCGCDSIFELKLFTDPSPSPFLVSGQDTVSLNQYEIYSAPVNPDLIYSWNVVNGVIANELSNDSTEIQWTVPGNGFIYSFAENQFGCQSDTVIFSVFTETSTKINTLPTDNSILVFPNPTKDFIHFNFDKEFTLEIFDMQGNKVLMSQQHDTNISPIKAGIYIVLIKNNENKLIWRKRIVKY